ncbi:MAG: PqqD family protein [Myxococcales bacterium]|nr:PqqD family protein [Myxococcales bacterium]
MTGARDPDSSVSRSAVVPGRDYRIAANAAWRAVEDHIFAITPDNRQHELSGDVEVVIWHALASGPTNLDALVGSLSESFDVSPDDVRADLIAFLGSLLAAQLIEEVAVPAAL